MQQWHILKASFKDRNVDLQSPGVDCLSRNASLLDVTATVSDDEVSLHGGR